MLYLAPPFFEIEGVVVGRDYSDPRQYWYYPNRPRIADMRLIVLAGSHYCYCDRQGPDVVVTSTIERPLGCVRA